ncbi:hypothetical protein J7K43_07920 [Candidatus Calescamantes bacterium]|nr:hypothetical protein [Candidatus Calescamantes bacterium]
MDNQLQLYIKDEGNSLKYSFTRNHFKKDSGFLLLDTSKGRRWEKFSRKSLLQKDNLIEYMGESSDVSLKVRWKKKDFYLLCEGEVRERRGMERAIIIRFQVPLFLKHLWWWEDIRRKKRIEDKKRYDNTQILVDNLVSRRIRKIKRTRFSRYPFSAMTSKNQGIAMAVPIDDPRICRIGYEKGNLFIEFDIGLSPRVKKFPSFANFTFYIYSIEPRWGMRSAVEKYYQIFPILLERRVRKGGIIMPTGRINEIQDYTDFHILGHLQFPVYEREYYLFNNRHGYLNLHYALPGTSFIIRVSRENKNEQTRKYATKKLKERIARCGEETGKNMLFLAGVRSMIKDEKGEWPFYPHFPVYCHGGMCCPCNPDPDLFNDKGYKCPNLAFYHVFIRRTFPNRSLPFTRLIEKGKREGFHIDGVGIDCMAWHTLEFYNHNQTHFPYADYPLSIHSKKPAIYNGISGFEYLKFVAELMRKEGKFISANLVNRVHHPWYSVYIDIPFTEIILVPQPDSICCYKKALYPHKPFSLLLVSHGSSFVTLPKEILLAYFHQCTFWAFYPSFHDAQKEYGEKIEYYWKNPSCYNRDRDLFKYFLPVIENLDEAGWKVLTYAWSSHPSIYVERYGKNLKNGLYFTLWNSGEEKLNFELVIEKNKLIKEKDFRIYDVLEKKFSTFYLQGENIRVALTLPPHRCKVLKISPSF